MNVRQVTSAQIKAAMGALGVGIAGNYPYHTGVFYKADNQWYTIFYLYGGYYSCTLRGAMQDDLPMIKGSYFDNGTPNPQWAIARAKSLQDALQYLTDFGEEMEREPGFVESAAETIGKAAAKVTGEAGAGLGAGIWAAVKEAPVVAGIGVLILGGAIYLAIRRR